MRLLVSIPLHLILLCISSITLAQPSNDDCNIAKALPLGVDEDSAIKIIGDTRDATKSMDPMDVCSSPWVFDDVWYSIAINAVPEYGIFVELYFDAGLNPANITSAGMAVYSSCNADETSLICFSDSQGLQRRLELSTDCLTANTTYYIRIWSTLTSSDLSGTFEIAAYNAPAPRANQGTIYHEDFNEGLGAWSTTSLTDDDTEVWQWSPDGNIPTYFQWTASFLNLESACGGVAIYPAGAYQLARGTTGNPPYPNLESYLMSPIIDISNIECNTLALGFDMLFRGLNGGDNTSLGAHVEFSLDEGLTWSRPIDINDEGGRDPRGTVYNQNETIILYGLDDAATLQFRFVFDGDFYYWGIDNIHLYEQEKNDLALRDDYYAIPPNLITPYSQSQEIGFTSNVANLGCTDQPNTDLTVSIKNNIDQTIWQRNRNLGTFPTIGTDVEVNLDETYLSPQEYGSYSLLYKIASDSLDRDTLNNYIAFPFSISKNLFAKEDSGSITLLPGATGPWPSGDNLSWGYANHFFISNRSVEAPVYLNAVQLELHPSDHHAGQIFDVIAYEWVDGNGNAQAESNELMLLEVQSVELNGTEDGIFNIAMGTTLSRNTHLLLAVEHIADQSEQLIMPIRFNNRYDYTAMSNFFNDRARTMNDPHLNRFSGFHFTNDSDTPTYKPFTRLGNGPATVCIRAIINEPPLIHTNIKTMNKPEELVIYPNPAQTTLNIEIDPRYKNKPTSVTIFDITGQVILSQKVDARFNQAIQLDVSTLTTGTYFIALNSTYTSQSIRFIKE